MPLWSFLAALMFVALLVRNAAGATAAFVLLGNWAVNTALASYLHSQFCWPAMSAIDFLSALLLLVAGAEALHILMAGLYVVELVMHSAFGITDEGLVAQYHYWYGLHYAAWLQAWLVLGWIGTGGGKMVRSFGGFRERPVPRSPMPQSLARKEADR